MPYATAGESIGALFVTADAGGRKTAIGHASERPSFTIGRRHEAMERSVRPPARRRRSRPRDRGRAAARRPGCRSSARARCHPARMPRAPTRSPTTHVPSAATRSAPQRRPRPRLAVHRPNAGRCALDRSPSDHVELACRRVAAAALAPPLSRCWRS